MRLHIHCLDEPMVEYAAGRGALRSFGPGPTVVSLSGDLDVPAVPLFEGEVGRAIESAVQTLIVDLTHVDFVSIVGAQALATAQFRAERNGLALMLVPHGRTLTRALTVTGLAGDFRCFPSIRAAVQARREELSAHMGLDLVVSRDTQVLGTGRR